MILAVGLILFTVKPKNFSVISEDDTWKNRQRMILYRTSLSYTITVCHTSHREHTGVVEAM
jgi:hypothetical protein